MEVMDANASLSSAALAASNQDQTRGLLLAISSSIFIGSSFIIKKKGLRLASATGLRAGAGGFGYLTQPVWWAGLLSMVVGELANFAAYAFAPAIIVTPLGALSIIVSAVLAHSLLNEKLNVFGILGCLLCMEGSFAIVLQAPPERQVSTVREGHSIVATLMTPFLYLTPLVVVGVKPTPHLGYVVHGAPRGDARAWHDSIIDTISALATRPGFVLYAVLAIATVLVLVFWVAPVHGQTNLTVYIAICSLMGSLSVMSCKCLGIAIKLTLEGRNQFIYPETYFCTLVVAVCIMTQMNYLNKALDTFNTAIVSPVYYVMFTTLTILASMILFQDAQSRREVAAELCGFTTIVAGTFLLHTTKDMDVTLAELLALRTRDLGSPVSRPGLQDFAGAVAVDVRSTGDSAPLLPTRRQNDAVQRDKN